MQKACGRSTERVIISLLRFKTYQNKAAIIAWIRIMIIQMPKIAVIMPTTILSISITSFLYQYIHACRLLAISILALLGLVVKHKTTHLSMDREVI
jgi:hypothetical protein